MQTELTPIFKIRETCLCHINRRFYTENQDLIHRSALAAQDYVLSGTYASEYKSYMGRNFKKLAGYIAVHQKYNLPYNPDTPTLQATQLHPGLVMDLAWAFDTDTKNCIIDKYGNVRHPERLSESEIMATYHNTSAYGTPMDAWKLLNIYQKTFMLQVTHAKTGNTK